MPILDIDDILTGYGLGLNQRIVCQKIPINSPGTNLYGTLWAGDGLPTSGSYGTLGLANGRVCNQSTSGAVNFTTSSSGRDLYLLDVTFSPLNSSAYLGNFYVLDRISDVLVSHSSSTGAITGLDATSRLGPTSGTGEGAQILIETQTNFSAAANSFKIQYTNQNGLTGRITPIFSTVASRRACQIGTQYMFIPLQSGDTGVRSIQAITQSSGTATGQMAICLVQAIADIPGQPAGIISYKSTVHDLNQLPKIQNNACLMFAYAGITGGIFGSNIELILMEA